ncbi:serine/threonine protein kinase [Stigmatella aurantiaca]|uniref:Serine/threonine protein kinase n=1 Tax=Stigmatella aurantiaca TaxID=41 RepID=A0A1H7SW34_STIAU|nr:serine/threonine-protein kinase [Stigmatella aurantiaca]SEL76658.1 serine/threonine protein kinase [Stigmatella aurantiaca]
MRERILGPYRLLNRLGRGGMGEVWEAEPLHQPGARVALKVLHGDERLSQAWGRFIGEARIGALLDHPHIVRTLDLGREGEDLYLVMERLEGMPLSHLDLVSEGPLPCGMVVEMGLQVLEALAYAQNAPSPAGVRLGLIHRDLKPSNLFLTAEGKVKLIDFGIAQAAGLELTQTRSGLVRGSLPYLSPEQARGEALDTRSDLFSLGLVLHELLTGRRVFHQSNEATVLSALLWSPIPPVRQFRADVPVALNAALMWALRRDKEERPACAEAFAEALRTALPAEERWTPPRLAQWSVHRKACVPTAPVEWTAVFPPGTATVPSRLTEVLPVAPPEPVPPVPRASAGGWRGAVMAAGVLLVAGSVGVLANPWGRHVARQYTQALALLESPPPMEDALPPGEAGAQEPARTPAPAGVGSSSFAVRRFPSRPPAPPVPPEVPGYVTIESRQAGAALSIGGISLGAAPLRRHKVSPGAYTVEAVLPDGRRQQKTFQVAPGTDAQLLLEW